MTAALNAERELEQANHRLAQLLNQPPATLSAGGERAMRDELWIWGVLGGKNVGKTTLINALAGQDVVEYGDPIGEGTYVPWAYCSPADEAPARARLESARDVSVQYRPAAPESMSGLVLVDLPDFDSSFADHAEQVRKIATVLDGVIWVTTPKKVSDLRAIEEIQRVLKSRTNFVYVLNKMDWLLAQSDRPPREELDRAAAALRLQAAQADGANSARTYLISARHRTQTDIRSAIESSRSGSPADNNGELDRVVNELVSGFTSLRGALTSPPTDDARQANKQANLSYQVRTQARQLLDHYQPQPVLAAIDRAASDETFAELLDRSLPAAYTSAIMERLNADRELFVEWSGMLFKRRVSYWPLLGLIAWPLVLLGSFLAGLRPMLPSRRLADVDDPFRIHGVSLEERLEGLVARLRSRLVQVTRRVTLDLPDASALATRFRADAVQLAGHLREQTIAPYRDRRPGWLGRVFRWTLPVAVLLWFPLVQPVLAWTLAAARPHSAWNWSGLVTALSASNVLAGLTVSLLVLAGLVAAIYSVAVRDTNAALRRIRGSESTGHDDALRAAIEQPLRRPIETFREQLAEEVERLRSIAA